MADPGFAGALSRKYDLQQQDADARNRLSFAQTGLTNTQNQLLPGETQAKNFATYAQGNQANALGSYYGVKATLAPSELRSEDQLRQAQAFSSYGQGNLFNQEARNAFPSWLNNNAPTMNPGTPGSTPAFSTGTDRVPGKGDGTVDTQPAILAPGEAVLNRAAAEHLGRGVIDMLNAIGAHKMGLDLNPRQAHGQTPGQDTQDSRAQGSADGGNAKVNGQSGATPGYAKGTSKVPGKGGKGKAAPPSSGGGPAPGPMSPEIMQALMQMGGGAGGAGGAPTMGMQPPGPPMPMPMPQVAR